MADDNFEEEDLFADLYADDAPVKQDPAPEEKIETAAPPEVKSEIKPEEPEQNGHGDQQMYGADEDDDDIDFNLGGNGYDAPANQHESHGPGIKEDG